MKSRELKMGLIMSVIISAAMGLLSAAIVIATNSDARENTPVPVLFISNILLSITVGAVVALVFPLGRMARALTTRAGAVPPSRKFMLLNPLPYALVSGFIVSLVASFAGVAMGRAHASDEALEDMPPFPVMWLGSWAKLLLPTLVVGYILAVIISPVVARKVGIGGPGAGAPRGPEPQDPDCTL